MCIQNACVHMSAYPASVCVSYKDMCIQNVYIKKKAYVRIHTNTYTYGCIIYAYVCHVYIQIHTRMDASYVPLTSAWMHVYEYECKVHFSLYAKNSTPMHVYIYVYLHTRIRLICTYVGYTYISNVYVYARLSIRE